MDTPENPLRPTTGDYAHALVRGVLSSIPLAGGLAAEAFAVLLAPPLQKRMELWMISVGRELQRLAEDSRVDLAALQESPEFITVLTQATQIALRNHQEEKLSALRNAIRHSATGINIATDLKLIFLRYLDELTPTHVRLLNIIIDMEPKLANVASWDAAHASVADACDQNLDREQFRLLARDLDDRTLIRCAPHLEDFSDIYQESYLMTGDTSDKPKVIVTRLGRSFVEFIANG